MYPNNSHKTSTLNLTNVSTSCPIHYKTISSTTEDSSIDTGKTRYYQIKTDGIRYNNRSKTRTLAQGIRVLESEWSRHITAAVCTGDEELCGVVDQTKGDDQSRASQQRGYSADTPALSRMAPSQCSSYPS